MTPSSRSSDAKSGESSDERRGVEAGGDTAASGSLPNGDIGVKAGGGKTPIVSINSSSSAGAASGGDREGATSPKGQVS